MSIGRALGRRLSTIVGEFSHEVRVNTLDGWRSGVGLELSFKHRYKLSQSTLDDDNPHSKQNY